MKSRFQSLFKNKTQLSLYSYGVVLLFITVLFLNLAWADEAKEQSSTTESNTKTSQLVGSGTGEFFVSQLSNVPVPTIGAKAWASYDANSGQFIAGNNLNERVEPASITKLMTAYLVFEAL